VGIAGKKLENIALNQITPFQLQLAMHYNRYNNDDGYHVRASWHDVRIVKDTGRLIQERGLPVKIT
jgi:hypothetical protein